MSTSPNNNDLPKPAAIEHRSSEDPKKEEHNPNWRHAIYLRESDRSPPEVLRAIWECYTGKKTQKQRLEELLTEMGLNFKSLPNKDFRNTDDSQSALGLSMDSLFVRNAFESERSIAENVISVTIADFTAVTYKSTQDNHGQNQ